MEIADIMTEADKARYIAELVSTFNADMDKLGATTEQRMYAMKKLLDLWTYFYLDTHGIADIPF